MMLTAARVIGLQVGWFACVLGAAAGRPLLGPAVVVLVAVLALARSPARRDLLAVAGLAILAGLVFDGTLALAGVLVFPPQAAAGWLVPLWMLALWANFALALDGFAWLRLRPALAAAIGALGGPLSYLAGARLGAVTLMPNEPVALTAIALAWALAMPLLVCVLPGVPGAWQPAGRTRSVS